MKFPTYVKLPNLHTGRISLSLIFWIVVILGISFGIYKMLNTVKVTANTNTKPFDARLLSCNEVQDAEPTEAFNTCLEMANAGWPRAQKKIAWAYTQQGDYQNFTEAYTWMSAVARYDRAAELVRYVMLIIFGDTQEDKEYGEEGIQRLANVNYAPASAYLGLLYKLDQNVLDKTSNAMWLLERAHQKDPEVFNAYQLAIIYSNGFGVAQNYEKAKQILLAYANHNFPVTTNNVAWFLATLEENPLTEPEIAVELAQRVTNSLEHANNHIYIDTLAATHAANGQFSLAVGFQKEAITGLKATINHDNQKQLAPLVDEYEERLVLYKEDKKAVTETLDREYDAFFNGVKLFIERQLLAQLNSRVQAPENQDATDEQTVE